MRSRTVRSPPAWTVLTGTGPASREASGQQDRWRCRDRSRMQRVLGLLTVHPCDKAGSMFSSSDSISILASCNVEAPGTFFTDPWSIPTEAQSRKCQVAGAPQRNSGSPPRGMPLTEACSPFLPPSRVVWTGNRRSSRSSKSPPGPLALLLRWNRKPPGLGPWCLGGGRGGWRTPKSAPKVQLASGFALIYLWIV